MKKMYLPVIRADLCLEETYEPPTGRYVGVRTLAVHGATPGRDKEATKVGAAEAGLWVDASSAAGSRVRTTSTLRRGSTSPTGASADSVNRTT